MLTSRILRPGLDLEARTLQRPRRSRLKAAPSSPAASDTRISKGIWKSQSLLNITERRLSKDSMPVYPLQAQFTKDQAHVEVPRGGRGGEVERRWLRYWGGGGVQGVWSIICRGSLGVKGHFSMSQIKGIEIQSMMMSEGATAVAHTIAMVAVTGRCSSCMP